MREQIIKDAVERSNIETEDINETINLITGEISRIKTEGIDIDAYYSTNCPQEEFKSIFRRYESELKGRGSLILMICFCTAGNFFYRERTFFLNGSRGINIFL